MASTGARRCNKARCALLVLGTTFCGVLLDRTFSLLIFVSRESSLSQPRLLPQCSAVDARFRASETALLFHCSHRNLHNQESSNHPPVPAPNVSCHTSTYASLGRLTSVEMSSQPPCLPPDRQRSLQQACSNVAWARAASSPPPRQAHLVPSQSDYYSPRLTP